MPPDPKTAPAKLPPVPGFDVGVFTKGIGTIGRLALRTWLTGLMSDPAKTFQIAAAMYAAENPDKTLSKLGPANRALWQGRASAVLSFLKNSFD